jgi:DNA-binding MarR family transcriptional regulator
MNDSGTERSRGRDDAAVPLGEMKGRGAFGAAFLLSQLGFETSRLWRARLDKHGLGAREGLLLLHVANEPGQPQRAIAQELNVSSSLIVTVVDTLAKRRLIERRRLPRDRRVHALHITPKGARVVAEILEEAAAHEQELCAPLGPTERVQLIDLLSRIAVDRGLGDAVHPGFGDKTGKAWGRRTGAP